MRPRRACCCCTARPITIRDLRTILVYPAAYVAKASRHLPGGVVEEGFDVRLGESWHHGSVVLSWDDVRRDAADIHDGHNVVFHEFAHQLDSSSGKGDSSAVLQQRSAIYRLGEGPS